MDREEFKSELRNLLNKASQNTPRGKVIDAAMEVLGVKPLDCPSCSELRKLSSAIACFDCGRGT